MHYMTKYPQNDVRQEAASVISNLFIFIFYIFQVNVRPYWVHDTFPPNIKHWKVLFQKKNKNTLEIIWCRWQQSLHWVLFLYLFLKTEKLKPASTFIPAVPGSSENEPIEKCESVLRDVKQSAGSDTNSEVALASML